MENVNNENQVVNKPKHRLVKIGCGLVAALVLVLAGVCYFKFFFVFGEGVKSGELNYVVNKGYIFKTYEGKLIQAGFKGGRNGSGNTIVSNEFLFSVEDDDVAEELMRMGGKQVELHYKEYNGTLPWRGYSRYVVDGILSSK